MTGVQKGTYGVKTEVVLSDGQRFESYSAFAKACGLSYPALWRRIWERGQHPDVIAVEKGLMASPAPAGE